MPYKKYNWANNAFATLASNFSDTDTTMVLSWKYWRMPTSNFIVKITKTVSWIVTARENIYVTARSWATCTGLVRAYESVPIDDSATSNIQQALNFSTWDLVEVVISNEIIKDIQDELLNKYSNKVLDKWGVAIWNPSSYADQINSEPEFRPQQVWLWAWFLWIPWMDWIVTWWTVFTYSAWTSWEYTTQVAYSNLVSAWNSDVYIFIRRWIDDSTWWAWKQVFPLNLSSISDIISAPAWESLISTDALTLERIYSVHPIWWISQRMWELAANNRVSMSVMWNGVWFTVLSLILSKTWTPSDTLTFTIETDNAWNPSWTAVTNWTQTLSWASLTTTPTSTNITFPWTVTLTSWVRYHIVFKRQNTADASNYYRIGTRLMNTRFTTMNLFNTSWGTPTKTSVMMVTCNWIFMNIAVKATAQFQSLSNVDWFSQSSYSIWQTVSIYRSSIILTWLTKDSIYSLSDTAWVISTTPWTCKTTVWYALSSTNLLFTPSSANNMEVFASIRLLSLSIDTTWFVRRFQFTDNWTFIFSYSHDSSTSWSYTVTKNWVTQVNISPGSNSSNTYNIAFSPWDIIITESFRTAWAGATIAMYRTIPNINMIDLW